MERSATLILSNSAECNEQYHCIRTAASVDNIDDVVTSWKSLLNIHSCAKDELIFLWFDMITILMTKFNMSLVKSVSTVNDIHGIEIDRRRYSEVQNHLILNRYGYTKSFWCAKRDILTIKRFMIEHSIDTLPLAISMWLSKSNSSPVEILKFAQTYTPELKSYCDLFRHSEHTPTRLLINLPTKGLAENESPILVAAWYTLFLATTEIHCCDSPKKLTDLLDRLSNECEGVTIMQQQLLANQKFDPNGPVSWPMYLNGVVITIVTSALKQYSEISIEDEFLFALSPTYISQNIQAMPELLAIVHAQRWLFHNDNNDIRTRAINS
ncbi:hypothetical protein A1QO_00830 [Vibrio genomosp. F10 str. ZF-129]|uniref:Uncharacterized protein n=1 Tax=Vibrio genomosp. F10 str. ZF-129 TaxID=1187848 RepID=A0A1E5BGE9_9VIBR|nr:hypothetical protein [Vibrio genomosp. F10]OEE35337.1 hypothetical protein A1QO_00830 [Vibrio genomosp. F10 str. ZF-129]